MTVPAGMVSSRINARLLQPNANEDGLGVGVNIVPVTDGVSISVEAGLNTKPCVGDSTGDANASAVSVGLISVGVGLGVADKACAVCVSKSAAENVLTLDVRIAPTSIVGATVGCPPQAASKKTSKIKLATLF